MLSRLMRAAVGIVLILAFSREPAESANQDNTEAIEEAKRLDGRGRNEEAIDAYTEAIRQDPRDPNPLFARATLYDRLRLPELADADYDLAVQAAPGSAYAWRKRARNHHAKRRFVEELRDMDVVIRLDPASVGHYEERAFVHSLLGQKELAVADYARVIELDPDKEGGREDFPHAQRASIYFSLAQLQSDLKHYKEALTDFEHSESDGLPAQPEHGECLARLGRWKEAKEIYDRIVRTDADDASGNGSSGFFRYQNTDGDAPAKIRPATRMCLNTRRCLTARSPACT